MGNLQINSRWMVAGHNLLRHLKSGLLLVCFLIVAYAGFAQSTARLFHRLNIYHPGAPTYVTAIVQDQLGFMWIGSTDGLYRFDGYQFRAFRHNPADSNRIKRNNITCLYRDKGGNIWVGAAGAILRLDPKTLTFHQPELGPELFRQLPESSVKRILEDNDGQIWIVTDRLGLLRYDPVQRRARSFQHLESDSSVNRKSSVWDIAADPAGDLWAVASTGIYRYDPSSENFARLPFGAAGSDQKGYILIRAARWLTDENRATLWMGTDGEGLCRLDPDAGEWTVFRHDPDAPGSLGDNRTTVIYPDRKKNLWVGTVKGGLNRYDAERRSFIRYQTAAAEINSISDNHIYAVFEDRNGVIWVGTARGVDILKPRNAQFEFFQREPRKPSTLSGDNVLALLEDQHGEVWIGTRGAGLNRYNPKTQTFRTYRHQASNAGSLANDIAWSIHQDRQGRLWVGTSGGVLNRFDPATERFTHFALPVIGDGSSFFSDEIRSITEDEKGILWLATLGSGLFAFDPETESIEVFRREEGNEKSLSSNAVYAVTADQRGGVWVATIHGGVCYFDLRKRTFTRFDAGPKRPPNMGYADNFSVFIDRRQRVWVGTANGRLGVFNPAENEFRYFLEDTPEASYLIVGITEDGNGNLWLLTSRGLFRFTPPEDLYAPQARGGVQRYSVEDGLQDDDFDTGAVYQGRGGYLYVGGTKGFNRFHPDSLPVVEKGPEVILTDFQLFNQSVPVAEDGSSSSEEFFLPRDIAYTESITLTHRQRVFSIEFAVTDFAAARETRYAYRLEGFNPDWTDIGTQRSVTFTNLNPGRYTLQLKAANKTGKWSDEIRSLQIVITPPWYRTWWAYVTFAALAFGGIFFVYRFNLNRRLEQAEARQIKELDVLKNRLYTNITHEFRTPLTVIMGINENIRGNEQEKSMIRRNSRNLLRLVQQLLDLSKLDAEKLNLNLVQADIVGYLQYLTESFHSMAREKEIRLTFYSEEEKLMMDFDEEKMQQILYNLLSNAIKFTPAEGKINLHLSKTKQNGRPCLKIIVKDTGIGIPPEKLPFIFDRFYQVDGTHTRKGEGVGIGLALTKELVNMMKGEIEVFSTPGKGTEFTIRLPIQNQSPLLKKWEEVSTSEETIKPAEPAVQTPDPESVPGGDQPILLIIEDNPDVATYIQSILKKDYLIHLSRNGQEGIDQAIELIPDIIISDVMMPEKDGFEVCETLKKDERTSHIPIILLTAKAAQEDKVQGLKYGADAFLAKPFDKEELLIRLENLVELRRQLQQRYTGNPAFQSSDSSPPSKPSLEDTFLRKLHVTVQEHMGDAGFGVPQLAQAVLMSQMQVYRKLKALTEKTPSQFIRSVRLQKGMELLKTTEMTIAEIAYEVGFSDPNYFSRTFQQEFKTTPTDIRK